MKNDWTKKVVRLNPVSLIAVCFKRLYDVNKQNYV